MNTKLRCALIVCLFITIKLNAQIYLSFTHQADSVFQNLNKSGITTEFYTTGYIPMPCFIFSIPAIWHALRMVKMQVP